MSFIETLEVFIVAVKSITEPFITGTLIANPSNRPSRCGKINPIDFAAPEVVGIIDKVAALALLKGAQAIGFSGLIYTDTNIDILLAQRQLNQKIRSYKKRGTKIKKRKLEDNEEFEKILKKIIAI